MKKNIEEFLKDKESLKNLTLERKEDLGLLFWVELTNRNKIVSREDIFGLFKSEVFKIE